MFVLAGRFANVFAGRTFLTPVVDLGHLWAAAARKEKRNAIWQTLKLFLCNVFEQEHVQDQAAKIYKALNRL